MSDELKPRPVRPPTLPRFPVAAKCPRCGKGGHGDMTTISYSDAATGDQWISCGYCGADTPSRAQEQPGCPELHPSRLQRCTLAKGHIGLHQAMMSDGVVNVWETFASDPKSTPSAWAQEIARQALESEPFKDWYLAEWDSPADEACTDVLARALDAARAQKPYCDCGDEIKADGACGVCRSELESRVEELTAERDHYRLAAQKALDAARARVCDHCQESLEGELAFCPKCATEGVDAARAEEREACAKVADAYGPADNANDAPELFYLAATITAKQIAAALRARGESTTAAGADLAESSLVAPMTSGTTQGNGAQNPQPSPPMTWEDYCRARGEEDTRG